MPSRPRSNGWPVSRNTSQDCATNWVMAPEEEKIWQTNHHRYLRSRSDWMARRRPRSSI